MYDSTLRVRSIATNLGGTADFTVCPMYLGRTFNFSGDIYDFADKTMATFKLNLNISILYI